MRFVTIDPTDKFLEGEENIPGELFIYSEKHKPLSRLQAWNKFEIQYGKYQAPSWQFDIKTAARRLYPFLDAAREYEGLTVFIDPKIKVTKRLTEDFLRQELGRNYIGIFKRDGMPSKPDLYMVDGSYKEHDAFLEAIASILETGQFQGMSYWTDGAFLDEAIKRFDFPVRNLSGVFTKEKDPIRMTALAEYVDF
jgi:hypothetical protein